MLGSQANKTVDTKSRKGGILSALHRHTTEMSHVLQSNQNKKFTVK